MCHITVCSNFFDMPLSTESLLKHLQRFIKNSVRVKQIHSLFITNGSLSRIRNASSLKWTTTVLYNTLIRAYLNIHLPYTTLLLFTHMLSDNVSPNAHTFPSILKAATICADISKPLYSQALKRGVLGDPFVLTSFINLYSHSGSVSCARKLFDEIYEPCVVSCNAMLDGFCKNGDMDSAVLFFEWMPVKDVYTWTNVVNGYGNIGCYEQAICFFRRMIMQGCLGECFVKPNEATFVSVLSACAKCTGVVGLLIGKQIHAYIIKIEERISPFVGTALITLYGKMDGLGYASKVFENMVKKELCTWNAMIGTLASNGKENQALEMFNKMRNEGWRPNDVTFVAVLSGCARAQLVNMGLEIFNSMLPKFGIVPKMEHYGCVVDLFGRAGYLTEAKEFMNKMPFEPDATVLGALLGACKLHGGVELGNEVANRFFKLHPQQCGQYILLSSIYAEAEKWDNASSLRKIIAVAGIQKPPAYSTV